MASPEVTNEVIELVRAIAPATARIRANTQLLTELDLDSLRVLELAETIKAEFGVDLLAPPRSMEDMATPETIAAALESAMDSIG